MKKKILLILSLMFMIIPCAFIMVACTNAPPDEPPPHEEHLECEWSNWEEINPPTCLDQGTLERRCLICGATEYDYTPATGEHSYLEEFRHDATCINVGQITYRCEICGNYKYEEIPTTDHDLYVSEEVLCCDSEGYRITRCSHCSYFEQTTLDPLGHDYSETYTAPTCTDQGYTHYCCNHCWNEYYDYVPSLGHTQGELVDHQDPDCYSWGYNRYACLTCGNEYDEELPNLEHNYEESYVPATCTYYGYTLHTCSHCGDEYIFDYDYNAGLADHKHTIEGERVESTCTSQGYQEYECEVCGDITSIYLELLEHDYQLETIYREPTCLDFGDYYYECSRCDAWYEEYPDALGHDFDATTYVCQNDDCYEHEYLDIEVLESSIRVLGIKEDKVALVGDTLEIPAIIKDKNVGFVKSNNMGNIKALVLHSDIADLTNASSLENLTVPSMNYALDGYFNKSGNYTYFSSSINQFVVSSLKEVTILDGNICKYAFANLSNLMTVNLPDNAVSIGDGAFQYCGIETIDLTNITTIGNVAFENSGLKSIEVPSTVTSMGSSLFRNSTELLTAVVSSDKLQTYSFYGCSKLHTVELCEGIEDFSYMFTSCYALKNVTLPQSATNLYYCFVDCLALEVINLPKNVTNINGVLSNCSELKTVNYDIKEPTDYYGAFSNCASIENLNIGENVDNLPSRIFEFVTSIKTFVLPQNVSYESPIFPTSELKLEDVTVYIGKVEDLVSDPRTQLANLSKVTVLGDELDGGLLAYSSGVQLVLTQPVKSGTYYFANSTIESVEFKQGTTDIGSFKDCLTIKSVVLPSSVKTIADSTFENCQNLSTINLENIKSIGAKAFKGTAIETLTLPEGLESIGNAAFSSMSKLTSFNLPSTLTAVGNEAFMDATNVVIETLIIPSQLVVIGNKAFQNVGTITNLEMPHDITIDGSYGAFADTNITNLTTLKHLTNANVTNITLTGNEALSFSNHTNANITFEQPLVSMVSYAFYGVKTITTVPLAFSLTSIPEYAFTNSSIKTLTLPDSVVEIGIDAFMDCIDLESINLSKVKAINNNAFKNCSKLNISDSLYSAETIGDNAFKDCLLLSFDFNASNIQTIGEGAFNNTALTSVVIPESVVSVKANAFSGISTLYTIKVYATVDKLNKYMFDGTSTASYIVTPSIEADVFCIGYGNAEYLEILGGKVSIHLNVDVDILKTLVLRENVTQIGTVDAPSLTTLKIYSATTISDNAFSSCYNLTSLTIGNKVTGIYDRSFRYWYMDNVIDVNYEGTIEDLLKVSFYSAQNESPLASNGLFYASDVLKIQGQVITDLVIPHDISVSTINNRAFAGADIDTVVIGNSITTINSLAFTNTSLYKVTLGTNVRTIASNAFYSSVNDKNYKGLKLREIYNKSPLANTEVQTAVGSEINIYSDAQGIQKVYVVDGFALFDDTTGKTIIRHRTESTDFTFPTFDGVEVYDVDKYSIFGDSIQTLRIPECVRELKQYSLYRVNNVQNLYVDSRILVNNCRIDSTGEKNIYYTGTLSDWINLELNTSIFYGRYHLYINGEKLTNLIIPSDISTISAYDFAGIILDSVSIPSTVDLIEEQAFMSADFNSIELSAGVEEIETNAFNNCAEFVDLNFVGTLSDWMNITFKGANSNPLKFAQNFKINGVKVVNLITPDDITSIKSYTFAGYEFDEITINDAVEGIAYLAFENATFNTLNIGTGLTRLNLESFKGLAEFTNLNYLGTIAGWTSIAFDTIDSNLIARAQNFTIGGTPITGDFVLPTDVTTISDYAFAGSAISSITLHKDITIVGEQTFANCPNLVTINYNVSASSNAKNAFMGSPVTTINVGSTVSNLPAYVFNTLNLVETLELHDYIRSIGEYAMAGMTSLKSISIPKTQGGITVRDNAFNGNTGVETLYITTYQGYVGRLFGATDYTKNREVLPNLKTLTVNGYDIPEGMCYGFSDVDITMMVGPGAYSSVGAYAFYNCNKLVENPQFQTGCPIGEYAFYGCTSITELVIYGGELGDYAFAECSGVKTLTANFSATTVGIGLFENCTGVTSLTFDAQNIQDFGADNKIFKGLGSETEGVEVEIRSALVPAYAFYAESGKSSDINIKTITFKTLNNQERTIGDYAFAYLDRLQTIGIPEGDIGVTILLGCSTLTTLSTTNISKPYLLFGSSSADIPTSIKTVKVLGTAELATRAYENTAIETLIIKTTQRLGMYAFSGCSSLKSVSFDKNLTKIQYAAFYECNALEEVVYEDQLLDWLSIVFDSYYSNPLYYAHDLKVDGEVVKNINMATNGLGVKSYAFAGASMETITLSAPTVAACAFMEMPNLTSITLDYVQRIEGETFINCSKLANVSLENTTYIYKNAFLGCSSLPVSNNIVIADNWTVGYTGTPTALTLDESIVGIAEHAFDGIVLEKININESVVRINDGAFINSQIANVNYYGTNANLARWATNIKFATTSANPLNSGANLLIKDQLITTFGYGSADKEVSDYAFYGCSSLTTLTTVNGSMGIGQYAFANCANLNSISFGGTNLNIHSNSFDNCGYYNNSDNWKSIPLNGKDLIISGVLVKSTQYGSDIYINSSTIANKVFTRESEVTSVYITTNVTKICYNAFSWAGSFVINYQGTEDQWNALNFTIPTGSSITINYGVVRTA